MLVPSTAVPSRPSRLLWIIPFTDLLSHFLSPSPSPSLSLPFANDEAQPFHHGDASSTGPNTSLRPQGHYQTKRETGHPMQLVIAHAQCESVHRRRPIQRPPNSGPGSSEGTRDSAGLCGQSPSFKWSTGMSDMTSAGYSCSRESLGKPVRFGAYWFKKRTGITPFALVLQQMQPSQQITRPELHYVQTYEL